MDLQEVPWGEHVLTLGRALPPDLIGADGGLNDLETQRAEFPAVGAIGTARALAAIWSATVVDTQGVRLLPPELVSAATKVQSEGAPISGIPFYLRWGMGFELSSDPHPMLTDASFGHAGYGGQLAFADPRHRVGFAFVTNQLLRGADNRASGLVDTLRRILTSAADPVV